MLEMCTKNVEYVAIFKLRGRIAIGETEPLLNEVLSDSGVSSVVIDLAGVTAVDAYGLGVLLELRHQSHAKGIQFRLTNMTQSVQRIFEITCLNTVFTISSEAEGFSNALDFGAGSGHELTCSMVQIENSQGKEMTS